MLNQIPEYQSTLSRSKYYKDAYKDMIIQVGTSKCLNEFEKFVLQLTYQINVLFEEDIRVILNILNEGEKKYSLATTIKNLKQYDFIISICDDTYGKFYTYTRKTERLLNPHINSPSDFHVSDKIERYRLISAFSCVQLTGGLTDSTIQTLIVRFNKLSLAKFGLFSEIEKSYNYFRTVLINGEAQSILKLEEEYTNLIKTKTVLYSKRRTYLNQIKKIRDKGKVVITSEDMETIKELQRIEKDIEFIEKQMEKLRKYLGQNIKPYNSSKKDTVMTLQYFLQNGVIWTIKKKESSYICSVIYLDFSRYGNQHKLFEVIYNLSTYLQDRLDTINFEIHLSMFRVDNEKLQDFEKYSKSAINKFSMLRASGQYVAGIENNTLYDIINGNIYYHLYNILEKYAPYKKVIPLRFEEREYKKRYYEQKKMEKENNKLN